MKILENRKVFWCFQGVEKDGIGSEWINDLMKGYVKLSSTYAPNKFPRM